MTSARVSTSNSNATVLPDTFFLLLSCTRKKHVTVTISLPGVRLTGLLAKSRGGTDLGQLGGHLTRFYPDARVCPKLANITGTR